MYLTDRTNDMQVIKTKIERNHINNRFVYDIFQGIPQ